MNDPQDDAPLDPHERELAERLARGDDATPRDDDDPLLRDAASWVARLDPLLTEHEQSRAAALERAPDPLAVRDAVLAKIAAQSTAPIAPARRARSVVPLPWWRTAAPLAVAASLAALFLWQERRGEDLVPAAPLSERTELDADRGLRLEEDAARKQGAMPPSAMGSELVRDQSAQSAPMARRMAAIPTAPAEAESLLAQLDRGELDRDASMRAGSRLLELRAALVDTALVARIDRAWARLVPPPR